MSNIKKVMQGRNDQVVNLLWTGGWDSTFRLLQLLYIEKKEVQPIYIIDISYKSPVYEFMAMHEIRRNLNHREGTGSMLYPTLYIDKSEIQIDEEISRARKNIKVKRHLGKQYVLFASLCKQYGLQGIELSIEMPTDEERLTDSLPYHMQEGIVSENEKAIFKYFSLPILYLTKDKMRRIAKEEDWEDIMQLTWFCHHPIYHPFKKGIPCGICNPCRIAIQEGFGHRIPFLLRFCGKYLKKIYNSSLINFMR